MAEIQLKMRELRFILFCLIVLTLTGIFISCTTPKPPVVHRPPPATNSPDSRALFMSMEMSRPSIIVRPKPKPIPLAWDAVSNANHYLVYLSHGNQQWYKTLNVGTNTMVNLTNFVPPLEFKVSAVDSNGNESALSSSTYYGAPTNGWPMSVNGVAYLVFVAESNKTYTVSNSPIEVNRWRLLTNISGRLGLVAIPILGNTGSLWWTNR